MQCALPPDATDRVKRLLEQGDDRGDNWFWSGVSKSGWREEADGYQKFYEYWRNHPDNSEFPESFPNNSNFPDTFPYELSVAGPDGKSPLPFQASATLKGKIIVTESYGRILQRILYLRAHDRGADRGVVLTGQPGTGKTTFLKFILVWLISAHQVVFLCTTFNMYIFYSGKVYTRPRKDDYKGLPQIRDKSLYFPEWMLIDSDFDSGGAPVGDEEDIWPVQSTSPNPIRWKSWSKQYDSALLGMPLWTTKELMKGLRLRPGFDEFRSELGRFLEDSTLPTTGDQDIDAALEVLRTEREREAEEKAKEEKDNSASAMAHDKNRANQPDQPRAPVDKVQSALEILVHNATEEFGFIPRDVYKGVLRLPETKMNHEKAVDALDYPSLVAFVKNFPEKHQIADFSHRVVAVRPMRSLVGRDRWFVDFKSTRIRLQVMKKMESAEINQIRETFGSLRHTGERSSLAGWCFEAFAHRVLSGGWEGPAPQLTHMPSKQHDPPVFKTDPSSQPSSFEPCTRTTKQIKITKEFKDVTLDKGVYYKPAAVNNPLFDSFTIDRGLDGVVVISIFQMTISEKHGGSSDGYLLVRNLIDRVRELLNDKAAEPEVRYILVCPNDTQERQWNMPNGWNDSCIQRGHRGKAFCIRLPILLLPRTSLPKLTT